MSKLNWLKGDEDSGPWFIPIPRSVMADPNVGAGAEKLLGVLAFMADKNEHVCKTTTEKILEITGFSERMFYRHKAQLIAEGYVTETVQKNKYNRTELGFRLTEKCVFKKKSTMSNLADFTLPHVTHSLDSRIGIIEEPLQVPGNSGRVSISLVRRFHSVLTMFHEKFGTKIPKMEVEFELGEQEEIKVTKGVKQALIYMEKIEKEGLGSLTGREEDSGLGMGNIRPIVERALTRWEICRAGGFVPRPEEWVVKNRDILKFFVTKRGTLSPLSTFWHGIRPEKQSRLEDFVSDVYDEPFKSLMSGPYDEMELKKAVANIQKILVGIDYEKVVRIQNGGIFGSYMNVLNQYAEFLETWEGVTPGTISSDKVWKTFVSRMWDEYGIDLVPGSDRTKEQYRRWEAVNG